MIHPISQNRIFAIGYFSAWSIVEILHAFILWHEYNYQLQHALVDSLVSNAIYCVLGLAIWYPIYYNDNSNFTPFNKFLNIATAGIIINLIWYSLSYIILEHIYTGSGEEDFNNVHHWRAESGLFYFSTILLTYYIVGYQNKIKEKQRKEAELEEQLKEAELLALKSQINPHFLFNSLNSISSLTMYEPSKAQEMIIKLSDYLRYTVSAGKNMFSTYGEEIDNIQKYLEIERIRFGDRIDFNIHTCTNCKNMKLPSLILQPLFENAIKHGVNESTETVTIKAEAKMSGNTLLLKLSNNYPEDVPAQKGTGTGLKNVRSRLAILYGNSQLVQTTKQNGTYSVRLQIPQTEKKLPYDH